MLRKLKLFFTGHDERCEANRYDPSEKMKMRLAETGPCISRKGECGKEGTSWEKCTCWCNCRARWHRDRDTQLMLGVWQLKKLFKMGKPKKEAARAVKFLGDPAYNAKADDWFDELVEEASD